MAVFASLHLLHLHPVLHPSASSTPQPTPPSSPSPPEELSRRCSRQKTINCKSPCRARAPKTSRLINRYLSLSHFRLSGLNRISTNSIFSLGELLPNGQSMSKGFHAGWSLMNVADTQEASSTSTVALVMLQDPFKPCILFSRSPLACCTVAGGSTLIAPFSWMRSDECPLIGFQFYSLSPWYRITELEGFSGGN